MKRSDINAIIYESKQFLETMKWRLPEWAYWSPKDWKGKGGECVEIVENMLGWDITDFGMGDYRNRGLFLFTLRNGNPRNPDGKPYAEKILIIGEEDEQPVHLLVSDYGNYL